MESLSNFTDSLWFILLESGVWLVVGFLLAGIVHAFIPANLLTRQLGTPGLPAIAKASALGIPLPLCSCSVIPVAAGLRRGGAGKGASAAFTISTPQTGEESIPLTWALFGPVFALARPVIAVVTAFTAGVLIDRYERPGSTADDETHAGSCCHHEPPEKSCCHASDEDASDADACHTELKEHRERGFVARFRTALRFAFVTLPVDLAPWLVLGLGGAALLDALLEPGFITDVAPSQLVQMGVMLIAGVPLYVCATSTTPLAFSLVLAGLSPGAALVLLLAGPATNIATMGWVYKDLGARALAIYLAVIGAMALATGFIFNAFFQKFVQVAESTQIHEHAGSPIAFTGAVALSLILVTALALRYGRALVTSNKRDQQAPNTDGAARDG